MAEPDGEVELVLPAGRSVRRRREPARLVPLADALPELLTLRRDDATDSLAAWAAVTSRTGRPMSSSATA